MMSAHSHTPSAPSQLSDAPPEARERVLTTLNADGSRRWLRPIPAYGGFFRQRRALAWFLIALFVGVPFVRVGGRPAVLLDVVHRKFTFFGTTLLATDTLLLMLFMLAIFLTVFLLTALFGRVWCGWGCPQTVYMEFVFRPIERWLEGVNGKHATPARLALKYAVFGVLAVLVANIFLAWFVGVDALSNWVLHAPSRHPAGFAIVAVTSALAFFDFAWFREQMCVVACPYARLQSVLVDRRSLIVAYDVKRGEPRGKLVKVPTAELSIGDCVDCLACVRTCPTGVDIREGLQLECIACTQCIDACDAVMDKIHKPRGLIRYTSQEALVLAAAGRPASVHGVLRTRVVLYPALLLLVAGLFTWFATHRAAADITVMRGIGAPYTVAADGSVTNQVRIKIVPRVNGVHAFHVSLRDIADTQLVAPENPVIAREGEAAQTSVFVTAPAASFHDGKRQIGVHVDDAEGFAVTVPFQLLGPDHAGGSQ